MNKIQFEIGGGAVLSLPADVVAKSAEIRSRILGGGPGHFKSHLSFPMEQRAWRPPIS